MVYRHLGASVLPSTARRTTHEPFLYSRQNVDALRPISALVTLGSVGAAILAWVAKIRWSTEYREAKEAGIRALTAQITSLEKAKDAEVGALKAQITGLERFLPEQVWLQYEKLAKFYEETSKDLEKTQLELTTTKTELGAW